MRQQVRQKDIGPKETAHEAKRDGLPWKWSANQEVYDRGESNWSGKPSATDIRIWSHLGISIAHGVAYQAPPFRILLRISEVRRMEQVLCPNCGKPILNRGEATEIIRFCKDFWGKCRCGEKYHFRFSSDVLALRFPERRTEIVFLEGLTRMYHVREYG
jgi:hypothetical protein